MYECFNAFLQTLVCVVFVVFCVEKGRNNEIRIPLLKTIKRTQVHWTTPKKGDNGNKRCEISQYTGTSRQ